MKVYRARHEVMLSIISKVKKGLFSSSKGHPQCYHRHDNLSKYIFNTKNDSNVG